MLFNSLQFIGFFVVVYAVYLILTRRAQNIWLLLASWVFYGSWSRKFLLLMIGTSMLNYALGLRIHRARDEAKRPLLIAGIAVNLGILALFKYFDFFAGSLRQLLETMGFQADMPTLHLILPLGISFYCFHDLSYLVDVYRRRIEPTRSFVSYALYVALFPQLIAGPIARPEHLLPQIEGPRSISYHMMREGFWLILLGYYKKVVLADNMIPFTSAVFNNPGQVSGPSVLLGVYAFAFQVYGDFSGYSDIARGLSKLMGFELLLNFNRPYFAANPSDFWKRWHISFSTWLRDYLYIPLGGSRGGRWQTYRNLMLTMTLAGLWHGAAWHFVAWGCFYGLLLCAHRALRESTRWLTWSAGFGRLPWAASLGRSLSIIGFFHLHCLSLLLFAAHDLGDAYLLLRSVWQSPLGSLTALRGDIEPFPLSQPELALASLLLFAGPIMLMEWVEERRGEASIVRLWPRPLRLACYMAIVAALVLCGAVESNVFIYFQF